MYFLKKIIYVKMMNFYNKNTNKQRIYYKWINGRMEEKKCIYPKGIELIDEECNLI